MLTTNNCIQQRLCSALLPRGISLFKQAGTAIAMPSFCCCQVLLDGFRASADERFWANQLVNSEELGFSSAGSF